MDDVTVYARTELNAKLELTKLRQIFHARSVVPNVDFPVNWISSECNVVDVG